MDGFLIIRTGPVCITFWSEWVIVIGVDAHIDLNTCVRNKASHQNIQCINTPSNNEIDEQDTIDNPHIVGFYICKYVSHQR